MKLAFRLGFFLIPFLFFLSPPAYPGSLRDLGPSSPVVVVFTEASRSPASGSMAHQRKARLDECSGLVDLRTRSERAGSQTLAFLGEYVKSAAPSAQPYSGNAIGAQATVFRFGD